MRKIRNSFKHNNNLQMFIYLRGVYFKILTDAVACNICFHIIVNLWNLLRYIIFFIVKIKIVII